MPPKFGNYLFRNLQDQPGNSEAAAPASREALALEDRVITLGEADFVSNEALVPALAWDRHPGRMVEVRLGDTCGLAEGRVTIQAGTLRSLVSELVPANVPDDLQLPISLRSVVMQIHPYLEQPNNDLPRSSGPDFDTPIAQVAREDEGFIKLEPSKGSPPGHASPQAPEPSTPTLPLIREKSAVAASSPGIVVSVPRPTPAPPESHPASAPEPTENRLHHPFAGLPAVGPRSRPAEAELPRPMPDAPAPPTQPRQAEAEVTRSGSLAAAPSSKPIRRIALERLQEVFMTEDLLDVAQVLRLIGAFPKVVTAFAVTGDGEVHGGTAEMLGTKPTQLPALLKAVGEFARSIGVNQAQGLTLLGDRPASFIGNERLALIVFHESRNLPPGMKDRLAIVAAALADLLVNETPGT